MDYAEYLQAKNETRVIRDINGQKMLATIEASTTASKAYAIGDYLIANDKIYKVTAAIASGGTITVGTNVAEAKVGAELTHLNRQLSESITPAIEEIETALDGKAPVIINTASGEIASFADGADGMPIKSLVANIEPAQDLHGYDYPWPEGGGKNKIDRTGDVNGYYLSQNGSTTSNPDCCYSALVPVTAGSTYTLSGISGVGAYKGVVGYDSSGNWVSGLGATSSQIAVNTSYSVTFTVPSGVSNIRVSCGINDKNVQVESGSSATSYQPYANICPISGHTGASVTRTGKNLLDMTDVIDNAWINTANTNIGSIDEANVFYADVPQNTTVTYSADKGNRCVIVGYKTRPSTIMGATYDVLFFNSASQLLTYTFDTGDCEFVALYLNRDQANKPTQIQVEIGSTDSDYEPYTGNQISITFPSEAGTVYGGTLDVTNGVLTVDRAMVTVDGSQVPIANLSNTGVFNTYETVLAGLPTDKIEMYMSSRFKAHINSGISYMDNEFTVDGNKRIMIKAPNLFSTVNEANAYFVENPTQFVGLIQNPTTYQLTPQQLDTLLGTNNIWTDVGTVDVEYPADTKLYIEQLTKPTEDDMTANANIAANKFFMIGNTLYFSTAAIAQGATIIPGTNCNVISLADALNNLNS